MHAYRSYKHDAASINAGTGTISNWCCLHEWAGVADVLGGRGRLAAGVVAVVAGIAAADEPVRLRCADAVAVAPAAADAEVEDGAPGCAAPQLVPVVAPIADTP